MNIKRTLAILFAASFAAAPMACSDADDDNGGKSPVGNQGGSGGSDGVGGGSGGEGGAGGNNPAAEIVSVDANITSDTTWTKDTIWLLKKQIFVKNGATLTIEAGTTIQGEFGTAVIVTRGARMVAEGTKDEPIVFTSSKAPGERAPADWGGIILLGKAPVNSDGGQNSIEGFPASQGDDIMYGGNEPNDDSGVLKYVRIEFAGWEYAPDEEINSLTLGGVGAGTVIDYVQTHMGADDGIEFFGGTVNAKHLVVTRADDDSLDWDLGYTGKIQFVAIQQEELVGNCGYEADNDGSNMDKQPRSNPTIYNVTMVGSNAAPGTAGKEQIGMVLREGTGGQLFNHVVMGFTDFAIDIRDAATVNQFNNGGLKVQHSVFFGNNGGDDWNNAAIDNPSKDEGFDEAAKIGGHATNRNADPMLEDAFNLTAPSFMPKAGSPVLSGAATPPNDGFFDTSATFVGAFGSEDWTKGWTAYPES